MSLPKPSPAKSALDGALLVMLSDGRLHSGEAVASAMGVSRSGINKAIHRLRTTGAPIDAVPGRGYRMPAFVALDCDEILSALSTCLDITRDSIHVLPVVQSTNTSLMTLARTGEARVGTALLAERQTHGRGRNGHVWVSPCGATLSLSYYWRFEQMPGDIGMLSLGVGVAVFEALESLGFQGIALKWPNDIFVGEAKLGGILIEMAGQAHGDCRVVIGVGLNVDLARHDLASIQRPVADLKSLAPDPGLVNRNRMAAAIILQLNMLLENYESGFDLDRWRRLDILNGRPVSLVMGHEQFQGIAAGIDELGRLLVRAKDDSRVRAVSAGDVSLGALS